MGKLPLTAAKTHLSVGKCPLTNKIPPLQKTYTRHAILVGYYKNKYALQLIKPPANIHTAYNGKVKLSTTIILS